MTNTIVKRARRPRRKERSLTETPNVKNIIEVHIEVLIRSFDLISQCSVSGETFPLTMIDPS